MSIVNFLVELSREKDRSTKKYGRSMGDPETKQPDLIPHPLPHLNSFFQIWAYKKCASEHMSSFQLVRHFGCELGEAQLFCAITANIHSL